MDLPAVFGENTIESFVFHLPIDKYKTRQIIFKVKSVYRAVFPRGFSNIHLHDKKRQQEKSEFSNTRLKHIEYNQKSDLTNSVCYMTGV